MPARPRVRPVRLAISWVVSALSVYVAAALLPGIHIDGFGGAFLVAAAIAAINAVLPPLIASLRLPFTLVTGFLSILVVDAFALKLTSNAFSGAIGVDSLAPRFLGAVGIAALSLLLETAARDQR